MKPESIEDRCKYIMWRKEWIEEACKYLASQTRYDIEYETAPLMTDRALIEFRIHMEATCHLTP